jgi:transposase-like protein
MVTRIGKLELRVPLDREFHCSTELFDRYLRVVQCEVQR